MYYPLKFKPIYKNVIWGGDKLYTLFDRNIPNNTTGESWDICCGNHEISVVINGKHKGKLFSSLIYNDRNYLGTSFLGKEDFPLLIKLIDANDNLSIQVHPNDEYAIKNEKYPFGKTEMWYILDAPQDAFLILGIKDGITKEEFKESINNGSVERYVNKLFVKKGDVINIPAGIIHAITRGIVLAEIQQNSDITYRVFDYNRKGLDGKLRELHIKKALDVIDFDGKAKKETIKGIRIAVNDNSITYYIANKYFAVLKYNINGKMQETSDCEKFYIFTCIEGNCLIRGNTYEEKIKKGESIFIPACLGKYEMLGNCILLKSFVPNIKKDFIMPLIEKEISISEIKDKTYIDDFEFTDELN